MLRTWSCVITLVPMASVTAQAADETLTKLTVTLPYSAGRGLTRNGRALAVFLFPFLAAQNPWYEHVGQAASFHG
jgi:hypothetical protein